MKLTSKELLEITGGASITGTLINSISTGIKTVLDLGKTLGSAIRRVISGTICPI